MDSARSQRGKIRSTKHFRVDKKGFIIITIIIIIGIKIIIIINKQYLRISVSVVNNKGVRAETSTRLISLIIKNKDARPETLHPIHLCARTCTFHVVGGFHSFEIITT